MLFAQDGPVATLTVNRAEARNAMTWEMYEYLYDTCDRVDKDESIRVLILWGAGGMVFISLTDISQFLEFTAEPDARDYEDLLERIHRRMISLTKPVIAQIEGACLGDGLGIAINCDIRICSTESRFGAPPARLGNIFTIAGVGRLFLAYNRY